MAVAEPNDMNAIFDRMVEDLDLDPGNVELTPTSSLSDIELVERFNRTRRELADRGERLNPTTETGKDLGAQYHAYLLEMKKRGLQ